MNIPTGGPGFPTPGSPGRPGRPGSPASPSGPTTPGTPCELIRAEKHWLCITSTKNNDTTNLVFIYSISENR